MNLSKRKLTLHEKNALQYGLSHPILPRKVKKDQIKANVEKLMYNLKRHSDAQINDEIKDELKFMVKELIEDASSICSKRVNQSLYNTLYKLSKDPNIRVCKYDKGNGMTVMNTED